MHGAWYLRLKLFFLAAVVLFTLLIVRLAYLQIVQGDFYRNKSENNHLRIAYLSAPRGGIFDRNGKALADNRIAYDLELPPESEHQLPEIFKFLSSITKQSEASLKLAYESFNKRRYSYEQRLLYKDIDLESLARVAALRYRVPGLQIKAYAARRYPTENLAAHLVGYLREISANQLASDKYAGYRSGDLLGQIGVERTFEHLLQGQSGVHGIIVNAEGQKIKDSFLKPAQAGEDLHLTIDLNLQKISSDVLADRSGAIIALNPKNGEVLAMVSKPDFDPNVFTRKLSAAEWSDLINNPKKTMLNRVVKGLYPPGSIFKAVLAIAALEERIVNPSNSFYCPGHFPLTKTLRFHCHKRSGHGHMALENAMARSCNVYFYNVGQELGIDRIHQYASMLGLGQATGIELSRESSGLVPSREWKKRAFKERTEQRWYPGETPSVSIGQGAIAVTPIQIARSIAALVNGGQVYSTTVVQGNQTRLLKQLNFNDDNLQHVRESLKAVVNSHRGTGKRAALPEELGITVAGKTATAQIKSSKHLLGEDSENHAWFVGFAPYENPEILVVALVEHGGHGGETAAPVVKEVLEEYFSNKVTSAD